MHKNARHYTNWLYEQVDNGMLSWEFIAQLCLRWLSEGEVEAMCRDHDLDDLCHTQFDDEKQVLCSYPAEYTGDEE